jgi:capsular polysaccharide biosynthesis protein
VIAQGSEAGSRTGGLTIHVDTRPYPQGLRRVLSYRVGDVYLHLSGGLTTAAPPRTAGAPVIASTWDDVIELLLPAQVVDRRTCDEVPARDGVFEHLYPVLDPGGSYRFVDPAAAPAYLRAAAERRTTENAATDDTEPVSLVDLSLLGGAPQAFGAYCARTVADVSDDDGTTLVVKREHTQRVLLERGVETLAPTAVVVGAEPYGRVVAHLVGDAAGADRLSRLTDGFVAQEPPAGRLSLLRDVKVISYGTIVVADRYIVSESMIHNHHQQQRGMLYRVGTSAVHVAENALQPPGTPAVRGDCVVLKQNWDANYGHWLVDTLPRVLSVAPHYDLGEVTFLLNPPANDAMRRVYTQSMVLAGAREENLLFDGSHPRTVEHAVYPSPMSRAPLVKHPAAIRFLRGLTSAPAVAGATNHAPNGRIYLSRNGYGKREMLNEEQITPLLEDAGYVVLHPERLSFVDQVATFAGATHVVGNMGAAFTNLVFAPDGVKALCIGTELMQHDYFYDIVCLKSGQYAGMNGRAADRAHGIAADFTVDVEAFGRLAADRGFV